MHETIAYLLVLSILTHTTCSSNGDFDLKIMKHTGDSYIPVTGSIIEKTGANFSLRCDLVSSRNDSSYFDFQVSWIKEQPSTDLSFLRGEFGENRTKKIYSILSPSDINKAVQLFQPLRPDDGGKYICLSLKYDKHKVVELFVQTNDKPVQFYDVVWHRPTSCPTATMFRCKGRNDLCIIKHYTCDGHADCKDASDESEDTCNGDPCKDKLQCDDGRCIPTNWCCDRHLDPNCTVNNRPMCCQLLSDRYEESELGPIPNTTSNSSNGARYLFISIGALCILFVIVLFLLIVSRVMIMARKSDLEHSRRRNNIELRQNNHINSININNRSYGGYQLNTNLLLNRNESIDLIIDNCDVSDPLLFLNGRGEDQPPPYVQVAAVTVNLNEPPPPYTSREVLNEDRI